MVGPYIPAIYVLEEREKKPFNALVDFTQMQRRKILLDFYLIPFKEKFFPVELFHFLLNKIMNVKDTFVYRTSHFRE